MGSSSPLVDPLKHLESIARMSLGAKAHPAAANRTESFAGLIELKQAKAPSDVAIAADAGVSLSRDQLARIARAIDAAEAQGASTAIVLIDGRSLKVDVGLREVSGEVDLSDGTPVGGIDAIVSAGSVSDGPVPTPSPTKAPPLTNASIVKLLSRAGAHE